jgi:hypothetical protein
VKIARTVLKQRCSPVMGTSTVTDQRIIRGNVLGGHKQLHNLLTGVPSVSFCCSHCNSWRLRWSWQSLSIAKGKATPTALSRSCLSVPSSCSKVTRDALVVAIESPIAASLVVISVSLRSRIDRPRSKTRTSCKW